MHKVLLQTQEQLLFLVENCHCVMICVALILVSLLFAFPCLLLASPSSLMSGGALAVPSLLQELRAGHPGLTALSVCVDQNDGFCS